MVTGLDDGRLGVFGAYLGSDARRSSCDRKVETGSVKFLSITHCFSFRVGGAWYQGLQIINTIWKQTGEVY